MINILFKILKLDILSSIEGPTLISTLLFTLNPFKLNGPMAEDKERFKILYLKFKANLVKYKKLLYPLIDLYYKQMILLPLDLISLRFKKVCR